MYTLKMDSYPFIYFFNVHLTATHMPSPGGGPEETDSQEQEGPGPLGACILMGEANFKCRI